MARDSDHGPTGGTGDEPARPHRAELTSVPGVPGDPPAEIAELAGALDAEHALMHHIVVDIAIAIPVAIAVLVGMVAVAVSIDGAALGTPILMAVGIGTLAGVFFGTWAGFVSTAHNFEDLDRMGQHTPQH